MTLSEVISLIKEYTAPLLLARRKLIIAGLIGAVLFVGKALLTTPTYVSVATVHPDEDSGAASNPLMALLPAFSGGGAISPNQHMIEVLQSWRIRNLVAADTVMFEGKTQYLHDILIQRFPPKESWKQKVGIGKPFAFPTTRADKISFATDWLMDMVTVEEDENMFLAVKFTIPKYIDLMEPISESYFEQLRSYYKFQKTEKARRSLAYFDLRCDSVRQELEKSISTTARYEDKYKFNVLAQTYVPREEAVMKAEALKEMYTQLVISREAAVAQLLNDTPVLQVLDPANRVKQNVSSKVKGAIVGFIVGMLLMAIYVMRDPLKRDVVNYLDIVVQRLTEKEEPAP